MQHDLHNDDPKRIWQNQPIEAKTVNLILIRQKARELQRRARRRRLTTLTVPLVIAFFFVFCVSQLPHAGRLVESLLVAALAWSVAGVVFLSRGRQPGAVPDDAAFRTGIEFCQQELQRQRDYLGRGLAWSFGPVVLAIGTLLLAFAIVTGTEFVVKALPVAVLAVVWVVAYLLTRLRLQRNVQREIDELSDVDRVNSR